MALTTLAWHFKIEPQVQAAHVAVSRTVRQLRDMEQLPALKAGPKDFAQGLPVDMSIDSVVRELQRASSDSAVALLVVASTPHAATALTLGRIELTVTLRGSYPKLMAALNRTRDRYPELLLQRLSLRRMGTPNDIEGRASLVLVGRPSVSAGSAS